MRRWRTVQIFVRHFRGMCAICILYVYYIHVQGICTKHHRFRQYVLFFEYLILTHYFKTGRYLNAEASAEGASENKYNMLLKVNNKHT